MLTTHEELDGMNEEKLNIRNAYHHQHTHLLSSPFLLNDVEFAFSPVESPFLVKTVANQDEHPPPYTQTQIRSALNNVIPDY